MAKTTQQFSESDFCASQKHTVVEISRLEARTNQIETQQILRFCILQARRGSGGVRRCRFSGVSTDSAGDCPSGTKCCASAPPTARKAQDSPRNAEISDGTTQNRPKTLPQITPRPPKIKLPCWTANNRRCAWAPYVARGAAGTLGAAGTAALQAPPSIRHHHHSIQLALQSKSKQTKSVSKIAWF